MDRRLSERARACPRHAATLKNPPPTTPALGESRLAPAPGIQPCRSTSTPIERSLVPAPSVTGPLARSATAAPPPPRLTVQPGSPCQRPPCRRVLAPSRPDTHSPPAAEVQPTPRDSPPLNQSLPARRQTNLRRPATGSCLPIPALRTKTAAPTHRAATLRAFQPSRGPSRRPRLAARSEALPVQRTMPNLPSSQPIPFPAANTAVPAASRPRRQRLAPACEDTLPSTGRHRLAAPTPSPR